MRGRKALVIVAAMLMVCSLGLTGCRPRGEGPVRRRGPPYAVGDLRGSICSTIASSDFWAGR